MHRVGLIICQGPLQTAIVDAVTHTLAPRLRVGEFVNEGNIFDKVTTNSTNNFHDIVLVERYGAASSTAPSSDCGWGQPKGNVLVASRVLGEGFEASDLSSAELRQEALVA